MLVYFCIPPGFKVALVTTVEYSSQQKNSEVICRHGSRTTYTWFNYGTGIDLLSRISRRLRENLRGTVQSSLEAKQSYARTASRSEQGKGGYHYPPEVQAPFAQTTLEDSSAASCLRRARIYAAPGDSLGGTTMGSSCLYSSAPALRGV